MPLVDRVAHGLADEVRADRAALEPVPLEQRRAAPARSPGRRAPCRPRSDRPSRRARARRSPSRPPSRPGSSSGRSAHWPVKRVTGRAIRTPFLGAVRGRSEAYASRGRGVGPSRRVRGLSPDRSLASRCARWRSYQGPTVLAEPASVPAGHGRGQAPAVSAVDESRDACPQGRRGAGSRGRQESRGRKKPLPEKMRAVEDARGQPGSNGRITYLEAIRAALARRAARGRARLPARRGHRPLRRGVRGDEGPLGRVRRRAGDRHADRRGGLRRRRDRRRLDGRAAGGRAPVRRLRQLRLRPDRDRRGEDALALGASDPARDPRAVRRRRARRPVPLAVPGGMVRRRQPGSRSSARERVEDAYGLLRSAIEDDDPVLYFEHKALYRRLRGRAARPGAPHADRARRGSSVAGSEATVVTYAAGVDLALRAPRRTRRRGARPAHRLAVRRRRRARVARAGPRGCSCSRRHRARPASRARSSRLVAREGFELLDAPPVLVAPPDTPVPFAPELEDAYLPSVETRPRCASRSSLPTERPSAPRRRGAGRPARDAASSSSG